MIADADREAAAEWCANQPFPSKQAEAPMIACGEYDHHSLVHAFARHRTTAEQSGYDRAIAEVVAFLCQYGIGFEGCHFAELIKAGEHRKGQQ